MDFIIFNLILLLLILFLLIVLSMAWPPDSPWAPWWKTSKKVALAVCRLANITEKDVVYELGSGYATLLYIAAKKFNAECVGIEIDPLRTYASRILMRVHGVSDKVTIFRGNFFDYNYQDATVVFVYLVPKALEKLKPKFLRELKPETRIVSYRYEINLPLKKYDKENNLRLYIV